MLQQLQNIPLFVVAKLEIGKRFRVNERTGIRLSSKNIWAENESLLSALSF
jgi:uncharacterized membrane-anchored protein YitT (DUF2179 family)